MPAFLLSVLTLAVYAIAAPPSSQDSLRHEIAVLSAAGKLDAAIALVESSQLPASSANLLKGKLELHGDDVQKKLEAVVADVDAEPMVRGEALFRLGQLQYAAGHYRLAIPPFREYLTGYPKGPWADPAAYWMAYSCLQYSLVSNQKAYLDTGLYYLALFKFKKTPGDYYWPLASAAKARIFLARNRRGDSSLARAALEDAQRRSPPEEIPGVLLLSSKALKSARPEAGKLLEDSLLWNYPFSPEAALLTASPSPVSSPAPAKDAKPAPQSPTRPALSLSYCIQLGYFSVAKNAEEMRRSLGVKGVQVRIEDDTTGANRMHRVLYGNFADAASARKEGERLFKPLAYAFQITVVRP